MAFKYIALFAFVAVASAGVLDLGNSYGKQIVIQQQPIAYKQYSGYSNNYADDDDSKYGPAQYEFNYAVKDEHTGDIKEQKETRNGDKVEGYYTLVEADGHRRIVHYSSSKETGFLADVQREELKGYQAPQIQQIKYVQAAPQQIKYVQAPIVQKVIAAPAYYKQY